MKPYKDNPRCVKCGGINISLKLKTTIFNIGAEDQKGNVEYSNYEGVLRCICLRCGYIWAMETKDKQKPLSDEEIERQSAPAGHPNEGASNEPETSPNPT